MLALAVHPAFRAHSLYRDCREFRAVMGTPIRMCGSDVIAARSFKWVESENPEGRPGKDRSVRSSDSSQDDSQDSLPHSQNVLKAVKEMK